MLSRLPAALVVANAMMFDKPLKVLAETCEAQNSVFNMNMPLLLVVALVGATVGGKVLANAYSSSHPIITTYVDNKIGRTIFHHSRSFTSISVMQDYLQGREKKNCSD